MARRGTKVGNAYIDVHADNRDFINGLDRVRRRVREEFGEEGEQSGAWFAKQWNTTVENRITSTWKRIIQSATEQNFDRQVKEWGSVEKAVRKVEEAVEDMTKKGRAGRAITEKQKEETLRLLYAWQTARQEREAGLKKRKELAEDYRAVERSQMKEAREFWKKRDAAAKQRMQHLKTFFKYQNNMLRITQKRAEVQERVNERIAREAEQTRILGKRRKANIEDAISRYRKLFDVRDSLSKQETGFIENIVDRDMEGVEKVTQRLNRMYRDLSERQKHQTTDVADYRIDETDRVVRHVKDSVSSRIRSSRDKDSYLFSRLVGSRNDIVNLTGRLFQPIERLGTKAFTKVFRRASAGLVGFSEKLAKGGRVAGILARALRAVGKSGVGIVAAVVGAATGISALITAASIAASAVSSLAGMFLGVASSVGYAIGGVLASAIPTLYAGAAGIGALIVGVQGLTDAQKEQLKPLNEWYDGLKKIVSSQLFSNLSHKVDGLLEGLGPHFQKVLGRSADALSDVFSSAINKIGSPDFQGVLDKLDTHIPGIVRNLGRTFSGLARGITAVAAAIAPKVEEITGKIADAIEEWAEWAATPEGQKEIAMWFDRAIKSAKILWDVVNTVIDVVGQLFSMGKDDGDSWISGWSDKLEEFLGWLKSPEGQKAFETWMKNAKETAKNIGQLVDAVGNLFDQLDSPGGHKALQFIIDALTKAADAAAWLAGVFDDVSNSFSAVKSLFSDFSWSDLLKGPFGLEGGGLSSKDWWPDWLKWDWWKEKLTNLPGNIADWFKSIDWSAKFSAVWDWLNDDFDWYTKANNWLKDLPGEIANWLEDVDWSVKLSDAGKWLVEGLIDGIVDWLIPDKVKPAFQPIIDWVKDLFGIESPSTVFFDIGVNIIKGLINGLLSLPGDLWAAVQTLTDNLINAVRTKFPTIVTTGLNILDDFIPGLKFVTNRMNSNMGKDLKRLQNTTRNGTRPVPGIFAKGVQAMSKKMAAEGRQTVNSGKRSLAPLDNVSARAGQSAADAMRAGIKFMSTGVRNEGVQSVSSLNKGLGRLDNVAAAAGERAENAAINSISNMSGGMSSQGKAAVSSLASGLSRLDNAAAAAGERAENAAISAISAMGKGMASVAKQAIGRIYGLSGYAYSAGYSVGSSAVSGIQAAMGKMRATLYKQAVRLGNSVEAGARRALLSQSPSRVMMRVGEDAVHGFMIPLENSVGEVEAASDRLAHAMVGRFNVNSMYNKGRAASRGLVDGLDAGMPSDVGLSGMVGSRRQGGNYFAPGAVVVQSRATDPTNAARQMVDGIADSLVGA